MGVYPGSCSGNKMTMREWCVSVPRRNDRVPYYRGDKPEMRAWCVAWLGFGSGAIGRYDVDRGNGSGSGRLVGIAPEALSMSKGASNIRAYSMADVQTARKQLDQIAEFMKPESVGKVKSLLGRL